MDIQCTHRFEAPLASILATLADTTYSAHLARTHSFFAEIEPLSLEQSGGVIRRTLRYRARPFLSRLGPFSVPPDWFVWIEHSELQLASGRLTFENVPELASVRDKVVNRGSMLFRTQAGEQGTCTVRTARFELDFQVAPMLRPLADFALSLVARKLTSSLDEEARLLASWLSGEDATLPLTG